MIGTQGTCGIVLVISVRKSAFSLRKSTTCLLSSFLSSSKYCTPIIALSCRTVREELWSVSFVWAPPQVPLSLLYQDSTYLLIVPTTPYSHVSKVQLPSACLLNNLYDTVYSGLCCTCTPNHPGVLVPGCCNFFFHHNRGLLFSFHDKSSALSRCPLCPEILVGAQLRFVAGSLDFI